MYLLDTNVISEARKGERANRGVRSFLQRLERWLRATLMTHADAILPVDADVAQLWGHLRAPRPENVRIEELEPSQLTEFVRRMQAGHLLVSLRQLANRVPPGSGLTPPEACPAVIQGMSPRHDMVAAVTPYPTLNDALSERFGEPMCLYWVSWYAAPPPAFLGRALVDGHTFVRAHVVRTTAWIGRTA